MPQRIKPDQCKPGEHDYRYTKKLNAEKCCKCGATRQTIKVNNGILGPDSKFHQSG